MPSTFECMQLMLYFQHFICEIQSHHFQIDCCDLAIPLGFFHSNIMLSPRSTSPRKAYNSPHPRARAHFDRVRIEERARVQRERQEQINAKRAELKKQKEKQLFAMRSALKEAMAAIPPPQPPHAPVSSGAENGFDTAAVVSAWVQLPPWRDVPHLQQAHTSVDKWL